MLPEQVFFYLLIVFARCLLCDGDECKSVQINCNGTQTMNGPMVFSKPDNRCCTGGICPAYATFSFCFTCTAENYCSATWVKNGNISYPFGDKDNFCIRENNTLMDIRVAMPSMKGTYTCKLSNRTHFISRDFIIEEVCDKPPQGPSKPKPHQQDDGLCSNQRATLGENATFYCEFCTSVFYNETHLQWSKLVNGPNNTSSWIPVEILDNEGATFITKNTVVRNCANPIHENADPACLNEPDGVGSYLYINGVTEEALGQYKLVAATGTEIAESLVTLEEEVHYETDLTAMVLGILAGLGLLVTGVLILWYQFNLDVKLMVRDRFGETEARGQRSYDAFIAYDSSSDTDRQFVLEVIRPMLMEHKCEIFVKDIDATAGSSVAEEVLEAMNNSLRCILLVSQSFLSSRHLVLQINTAIDRMTHQQTKIIPILYGDVNIKNISGDHGLGRLLIVLRCLKFIEGKTNKTKFLKRLLLRMPLKPDDDMDEGMLLQNIQLEN